VRAALRKAEYASSTTARISANHKRSGWRFRERARVRIVCREFFRAEVGDWQHFLEIEDVSEVVLRCRSSAIAVDQSVGAVGFGLGK
jgi:hypothetical protein